MSQKLFRSPFSTFKEIRDIKAHFRGASYDEFKRFELDRQMHQFGCVLLPAGLTTGALVFQYYLPQQEIAYTAFINAAQPYRQDLPRKEINILPQTSPMAPVVNSAIEAQAPCERNFKFSNGSYEVTDAKGKATYTRIDKDAFNEAVHTGIETNVREYEYGAIAMPGLTVGLVLAGTGFIEVGRRAIHKFHQKRASSSLDAPSPSLGGS